MQNVMLDLETWGTRPGCAIRSVGAVMFDPHTTNIGDEFYANVDDASCLDLGLIKDESTVKWWAAQSQQAQDSLKEDPLPLDEVIKRFRTWVIRSRGVFVWSQGANFDEPIIQAAFTVTRMQAPWKFWDVRDTRTAYDMSGFDPRTVRRAGTYHNAVDDARHQAICVQRAYAKNNGRMA
jgi:hypothetical protein